MEKIVLLCFPYAGGSAAIYNKWKIYLDKRIELVPVEIAGRGRRINEPFCSSIADAVEDIYQRIWTPIGQNKFSLFGHSMGSVIVYEICRRIRQNGGREPAHIFVSGRYPPHIKKENERLHLLPDDEFKREILKIGGTPGEVFEDEKLAQIFVPILKADYRLIEEYEYQEENLAFDCGITAFGGRQDGLVTRGELQQWQRFTSLNCKTHEFEGDHFFIHHYTKELTGMVNHTLSEYF